MASCKRRYALQGLTDYRKNIEFLLSRRIETLGGLDRHDVVSRRANVKVSYPTRLHPPMIATSAITTSFQALSPS